MRSLQKLLLQLVVFAGMANSFATFGTAADLNCPADLTPSTLEKWKRELAQHLPPYGLQELLHKCFPTRVPDCLGPLAEFAADSSALPPEMAAQIDPPRTSEFPKEFQVVDPDGRLNESELQLPKNLRALAKERGWKFTLGRTRASGGFGDDDDDGGGNLALFQIPGEKRDFFVQFNLSEGGDRSSPELEPGILEKFDQAKVRKVVFVMVDKTQTPKLGSLWETRIAGPSGFKLDKNASSPSCMGCHVNPLKAYSPVGYLAVHGTERPMGPEQTRATDEINQAMKSYGPLSWGSYVKDGKRIQFSRNEGIAPIGWRPAAVSARTDAEIRLCMKPDAKISLHGFSGYYQEEKIQAPERIRPSVVSEAMNCMQCHNTKGLLRPIFVSDENIARRVITDRGMPPGRDDLTPDERVALYQCLISERDRYRADWLARISCSP